jgi:hypothetical protein
MATQDRPRVVTLEEQFADPKILAHTAGPGRRGRSSGRWRR